MHILRALTAAVLLAFASGCAAAAAPRDPNTLVALTPVDGGTMNPLYATTVQDLIYYTLIFDGLTNVDKDYGVQPWLATSWKTSDGIHWDVALRHGVTWSDGAPFTAQDVVFTYRTMLDPKVAFIGSGDVEYVDRVEAAGPYLVHFTLKHPSALFVPVVLAEPMLPAHLLGSIRPERLRYTNFGQHPIGTGPYMLDRWSHDTEAVFVRNPRFWRGPAKIPRVDFRIIFNDQAQVEAMENGSADLMDSIGVNSALRLAREAPHIVVLTFPSLYVETFEVNLHRPGLEELVVRQAMMYGFDRQAVVHGFFDDRVAPANSVVVRALKRWYDPNVRVYDYDPPRARAMLEEAGWHVGTDGVRHKGAHRLSFELLVNQGSPGVIDRLMAFVADMRDIGIEINVRQLDFPSISARTYQGRYDLVATSRGGAIDPDWTTVFASWQKPPAGANTTGYADPIVDRDLREGIRTVDYAKRKAIYDDMQARLAETLPMLWLDGAFAAAAHSPRLHLDPKVTLQSPLMFYNIADWTLGP
jgi:peptide/nickel transport system substrate-binding protein